MSSFTPQAIDLPDLLSTLGVSENALRDAPVKIYLLNGERLIGRLEALIYARKSLWLRESGPASRELNFSEIGSVLFADKISIEKQDKVFAAEIGFTPPLPYQLFSVTLSNDGTVEGRMKIAIRDRGGLHLMRLTKEGLVQRVFFPAESIKHSDLGNLIGEALIAAGLVTNQQINEAVKEQRRLARAVVRDEKAGNQVVPVPRLGELLVSTGVLSDRDLHRVLAQQVGIPFVELEHMQPTPEALALIPRELARQHGAFPIRLLKNALLVAIADPLDKEIIDTIQFISNHHVSPASATRADILSAIETHYSGVALGQDILDAESLESVLPLDDRQQSELREAERISSGRPVVRLVTKILLDAVNQRASDIHIRPKEDMADILYRIDGTLIPIRSFTKGLLSAVVGRIKIIGRMDIAERRLPQDGHAKIIDNGNAVDLRISVIPTVNGESVVIRLLNTQQGLKSIEELGFNDIDAETFINLLNKSYGIILVTGPTGSGKSTTLYAALQEVIDRNLNIITVEDPVEYHIEGIEQIQVNTVPGYTFAKALRHILRHDPDVIMVGEIRDQETAKIAIESALTGHLVLSTLHTNDAPGAINRLLEMGIDPFLLNGALLGVFAQRLLRRNCPHCLVEEKPEPRLLKALEITEPHKFYIGTGCDKCNDTGYHGRMAAYELLSITPAMHALIDRKATLNEVREQALKDGMLPLTLNALDQALQKKTSLAEVYRVRLE